MDVIRAADHEWVQSLAIKVEYHEWKLPDMNNGESPSGWGTVKSEGRLLAAGKRTSPARTGSG